MYESLAVAYIGTHRPMAFVVVVVVSNDLPNIYTRRKRHEHPPTHPTNRHTETGRVYREAAWRLVTLAYECHV